MKILIIDDEQRLLDALSAGFEFQWRDAEVLRGSTAKKASTSSSVPRPTSWCWMLGFRTAADLTFCARYGVFPTRPW